MSAAEVPPSSGIVLAGGRSSRFGRDKLAELVGDRPLLHLAIEAVAAVSRDVIVVTAPGEQPIVPPGTRIAHDETWFEGPLAGCFVGLVDAREPLALVVGGDMPSLEPAVLGLLVRTLGVSSADVAVLEHRGRRQQLPFAIRTGSGTDATRRLLAEGERSLGSLGHHLHVRALSEEEWRPLDPDARTLRDVDEPADLPAAD